MWINAKLLNRICGFVKQTVVSLEVMFFFLQESGTQDQIVNTNDAGELMASGSHKEFSFARKSSESPDLQQDIQNYIRNSEKGFKKGDIDLQLVRSNGCDLGEYNLQAAAQSLVFDRVVMRNRIESGSLLLCNGGISVPFSPFASFV